MFLLQWHLQYCSLGMDFFLSDGQPSKTIGTCSPDQRQCVFTNSEYCRAAERQRGKVESVQKGICPKYSICHTQSSGKTLITLSCYELGGFHTTQLLFLPKLIYSLCNRLASTFSLALLVCVPFHHYYMHLYYSDEVRLHGLQAFHCLYLEPLSWSKTCRCQYGWQTRSQLILQSCLCTYKEDCEGYIMYSSISHPFFTL